MTDPNETRSTPAARQRWTLRSVWAKVGGVVCKTLQGYLKSSLGTALWTVCLLVGGVIFILYFGHISFMPELDLNSSITFLATSAFTGAFLVIVLAFWLMYPGWAWASVSRH